jgi:hypothetical protein
MRNLVVLVSVIVSFNTWSQSITKRVLFIGNSYTYVNNLPQMIADVANSNGDVLVFDSNTPGGCTLEQHSLNTTSLNKIMLGTWDDVVLQEQSQLPSFSNPEVATMVFPFAHKLDSIILKYNPCAETVFYMTWGRKNGDASNCAVWPPVCTYNGMDSLLHLRYVQMAADNHGVVSPVGALWKYIRQNFPAIELYSADESHPSVAGTYAAACSFYATVFKKNPSLISFNSTLSASDAMLIRDAAKLIVFDSLLNWHVGEYDPIADFTFIQSDFSDVSFTNTSTNSANYHWNFGDGNSSLSQNAVHTYASNGTFTVQLIADSCGISDTTSQVITIDLLRFSELNKTDNISISPNPTSSCLSIQGLEEDITNYQIINILGVVVGQGVLEFPNQLIDVNELAKGIYYFHFLKNTDLLASRRFVKK